MDAVQKANSGHPGTAMALAPVAYLLYREVMRHDPTDPTWPDRDRFVLSAGHACILQYAALTLSGYDLTVEDLKQFRQFGSRTPGHPEYGHTAGVETTTGPLGQGIGNAVGFALAERMLAARYNRPGHEIVDHRTYVVCSDGDLMEGVSGEASSIAGHLALGRLIAIYDDNHITIDGDTAIAFTEDVGGRYAAYGWHVQRFDDTWTLGDLRTAIDAAHADPRPSMIILRTHIAPGAPTKQDSPKAHGAPLGEEEIRGTKRAYGWPEDEHFLIPDDVREHMDRRAAGAGAVEPPGRTRFAAYRDAHPDLAAEFERVLAGQAAGGLGAQPADVRARRRHGDARVERQGAERDRAGRAGARRRLGRPGGVEPDARSRAAATCGRATTRAATSTSASASTAWARSSTGWSCTAASRASAPRS